MNNNNYERIQMKIGNRLFAVDVTKNASYDEKINEAHEEIKKQIELNNETIPNMFFEELEVVCSSCGVSLKSGEDDDALVCLQCENNTGLETDNEIVYPRKIIYSLGDKKNQRLFKGITFSSKSEIKNYLRNDFINFREGEYNNEEDLTMEFMLDHLSLEILKKEVRITKQIFEIEIGKEISADEMVGFIEDSIGKQEKINITKLNPKPIDELDPDLTEKLPFLKKVKNMSLSSQRDLLLGKLGHYYRRVSELDEDQDTYIVKFTQPTNIEVKVKARDKESATEMARNLDVDDKRVFTDTGYWEHYETIKEDD